MKLIFLPGFEATRKPPICIAKGPLYIICGNYKE
jgi:hypothetical protein